MPNKPGTSEKPTDTCLHDGCNCEVDAGQWYCSQYCNEQAKKQAGDSDQLTGGDGRCQCGHPQCHAEEFA